MALLQGHGAQQAHDDSAGRRRRRRGAGNAFSGVPGGRGRGAGGAGIEKASTPTLSPLYKTRLCSFFEAGSCRAGPLCSYAHGEGDLRPSPDFERTSVCPAMLRDGRCSKPGCRYAHSSNDLRVNHGLLKTKMCSFFLHGECVVGAACRFAHTVEELKEAATVTQNVMLQAALTDSSTSATPMQSSSDLVKERRRCEFFASPELPEQQATPELPGPLQGLELEHFSLDNSQPEQEAEPELPRLMRGFDPIVRGSSLAVDEGDVDEVVEEASNNVLTLATVPPPPPAFGEEKAAEVAAGRVVVAAASLAATDCREGVVDSEAVVWNPAVIRTFAGVGGAVLWQGLRWPSSVSMSKALFDIEDLSEVDKICEACALRDHNLVEVKRRAVTADMISMKDTRSRCHLQAEQQRGRLRHSHGGSPDCALCSRSGKCSGVPCVACDCGLRIISKNTFLTLHEDKPEEGSRRRTRSQ